MGGVMASLFFARVGSKDAIFVADDRDTAKARLTAAGAPWDSPDVAYRELYAIDGDYSNPSVPTGGQLFWTVDRA